jgi:hypothetical protein
MKGKISINGKKVSIDEIEGQSRITFLTPKGAKTGYFRPDGKIGTRIANNHPKKIMMCSCDGKYHTFEECTPLKFSEKDRALKCDNCGKLFEVIKLPEDFRAETEARKAKALENLHLYAAGNDWECFGDMYKLSTEIEYGDWKKIKQYFEFWTMKKFYDSECEYSGETGWLTTDPGAVENILVKEGLIKPENTLKVRRERAAKEKAEADKKKEKIRELKAKIAEKFENAEYPQFEYPERIEGEEIQDPQNPQNIYGGGYWWIINKEKDEIWSIVNNGTDGGDWSRNNVATGGAGAIGERVKYSEELEKLIREYVKM